MASKTLEKINMKKVAIIGGNSLIAKSFYRKFKEKLDIHSFARRVPTHEEPNFHQVNWSSLSQEQMTILGESDYILYCIGETNGPQEKLKKINIDLLKEISTYLKSQQKIIFISSVAIEFNNSYYSMTKREGEEIIKEKFKNFLILRPSMLYGKGDKKNLEKIKNIIQYIPIIPILSPDYSIQPLFVDDLAEVAFHAIDSNLFPNKAYALSGPKQIPTRTIIEMICKKGNLRRRFLPIPLGTIQAIFRFMQMCSPITIPLSYQIQNLKSHPEVNCKGAMEELGFLPTSFEKGYFSF